MTETTATADLVAALSELSDPVKAGKVEAGQRRYRYLELDDLLAEVRSVFGGHGWAVLQPTQVLEGPRVAVVNVWLHRSGERIEHPEFALPCGRSAQEVGSAMTYARRYSLAALVGLAGSDDDDGAATTRRQAAPPTVVQPPPQQQPTPRPPRDEPPQTPTADQQPDGLVTPAQMRKIGALIGEWETAEGRTLDRGERRRLIGFMAGVPDPDALASAKDLTKAQASEAIDQLQAAVDAAQPATETGQLVEP